jgi:hypothetical protein
MKAGSAVVDFVDSGVVVGGGSLVWWLAVILLLLLLLLVWVMLVEGVFVVRFSCPISESAQRFISLSLSMLFHVFSPFLPPPAPPPPCPPGPFTAVVCTSGWESQNCQRKPTHRGPKTPTLGFGMNRGHETSTNVAAKASPHTASGCVVLPIRKKRGVGGGGLVLLRAWARLMCV